MKPNTKPELWTVREAANAVGVNRSTINRQIDAGHLKRLAGNKVAADEVRSFYAKPRRGGGRPRGWTDTRDYFGKPWANTEGARRAEPFLGGNGGLKKLEGTLAALARYCAHKKNGTKEKLREVLMKAVYDLDTIGTPQEKRKRKPVRSAPVSAYRMQQSRKRSKTSDDIEKLEGLQELRKSLRDPNYGS